MCVKDLSEDCEISRFLIALNRELILCTMAMALCQWMNFK